MVATQIILFSWWFNPKNLIKKPNKKDQPKRPHQNGWVQIDLSKMALWSSWIWGQKPYGGVFFLKMGFLVMI
jgi:hypothetical protein